MDHSDNIENFQMNLRRAVDYGDLTREEAQMAMDAFLNFESRTDAVMVVEDEVADKLHHAVESGWIAPDEAEEALFYYHQGFCGVVDEPMSLDYNLD